ncbi:MAG: hypothetical protein ACOCRV_00510 [bacterium]
MDRFLQEDWVRALQRIDEFGIKTAVISNASLITEAEVRNELKSADWVSLKVDAVTEKIWKEIDRPHGRLNLAKIKEGIQIFKSRNIKTEYLIGYEGNRFSSTGDLKKDLLNITAVHPLKEEAVAELIKKTKSSWKTVADLIADNNIATAKYNGDKYYLRK